MRVPEILEREMGCSREEFLRWLPAASGHAPARADGGELVLAVAAGQVRILLRELPPRRIAGLSLPVLGVRFAFVGLGAEERRAFLERFDLYTRRGGG